jgi:hypothetical protein
MKCQSDYDKEAEAQLRQADECVEEFWDPNAPKPAPEAKPEDVGISAAEEEALKRGLVKVDEKGETCVACAPESAPKK